eukprot:scaffold1330_cov240-Pinguiococcus_pyrenoidosus.AAC.3
MADAGHTRQQSGELIERRLPEDLALEGDFEVRTGTVFLRSRPPMRGGAGEAIEADLNARTNAQQRWQGWQIPIEERLQLAPIFPPHA